MWMNQLMGRHSAAERLTLSSHFTKSLPWRSSTRLTPARCWCSSSGCMCSGLSRASCHSTRLSGRSVGPGWPRGLLSVDPSVFLCCQTTEHRCQISCVLLPHSWQQSIQTPHHARLSEEEARTDTQWHSDLWQAGFNSMISFLFSISQ